MGPGRDHCACVSTTLGFFQPTRCKWLTFSHRSDGAGEVVDVGPKVTRFQKGARVMSMQFPTFLAGNLTPQDATSTTGNWVDGVLREYAAYNEEGLVEIPSHLSYAEASTLPCAALTAWNALYGSKALRAGDVVLTQGTGGVSMFALQFAAAAGAQVISTTSSAAKCEKLKELGAHLVINYKEDAEWGETAKKLSLGGRGADFIIEVGGPATLGQSSKAAAIDAMVAIVGTRAQEPGDREALGWNPHSHLHATRRILVGNRMQFEEMNRAIEVNQIRPVMDPKRFSFEDAKEAFQYLWEQKHFGKVVIEVA